jgi:uridine phosphorylase
MLVDSTMQYHVHLRKGDIGKYVLLPGDPGRCKLIASYFDDPCFIVSNREYTTFTGTLLGEQVSVTSTGIGCPSTAIAVEELIKLGAHTFIRIGTAGGVQEDSRIGDLAILTGAIRDEGTTPQYMPIEYPAIANLDVVVALRTAAIRSGLPYHVGVSHSKDSFYGEVEPERMPVSSHLLERWNAWKVGGAICSEMESSALFIIAGMHRRRAGGVMLVIGDPTRESENAKESAHIEDLLDINRSIKVGVEAIKLLIEQDRQTNIQRLTESIDTSMT